MMSEAVAQRQAYTHSLHPLSQPAAVDTSVSLVRLQQGEQAVTGVHTVFWYPLGSVQLPHHIDATDAQ